MKQSTPSLEHHDACRQSEYSSWEWEDTRPWIPYFLTNPAIWHTAHQPPLPVCCPSNSRGIRDRLWCPDSIWVEVTSACPRTTRCRMWSLSAGSSPPPWWAQGNPGKPNELSCSLGLPSPGLVSFKCRFYCYLVMVTGDDTSGENCHWKGSLFSRVPRGGDTPHHGGAQGSTGWVSRQREEGENMGRSFSWGLHGKERARQGKPVWAGEAVPGWLVTGVIRAGD